MSEAWDDSEPEVDDELELELEDDDDDDDAWDDEDDGTTETTKTEAVPGAAVQSRVVGISLTAVRSSDGDARPRVGAARPAWADTISWPSS